MPDHIRNIKYFICLLSTTSLSWGTIAVLKLNYYSFPAILLFLCGGLSPAIWAFILIRSHTKKERAEFYKKLYTAKATGKSWMLIIFLYPMLTLFSLIFESLLTNSSLTISSESSLLHSPVTYFLSFFTIIMGVLGEEIGWRGYAQRFMGWKGNFASSSLVIGIVWILWHIPLFFIKDTYQYEIGFLSPDAIIYMIELLPLSMIMGYCFYIMGKSTLAMVAFHFMININPVENIFLFSIKAKLIRFFLFLMTGMFFFLANRKVQKKESPASINRSLWEKT